MSAMHPYRLNTAEGEKALQIVIKRLQTPQYESTAISLLCRLQFRHFSEHAYLITNHAEAEPSQHVYVFLDRARRPETELWMFGSWEVETNGEVNPVVGQVLTSVIDTVRSIDIPQSMHASHAMTETGTRDRSGMSREDYGGHARHTNIMLCGAIHEKTYQALRRIGALHPEFVHTEHPHWIFVFELDRLPAVPELPDGLQWGSVEPRHFELVRSRTLIPRQDRTLAILPSVAIYPNNVDEPIAWGFIGVDSSLTTIHVEPRWRGMRLGKMLVHKLLTEHMGGFEGTRFGSGHVSVDNVESIRLCRSVGGRESTRVYWLRVQLTS